MKPSIACVLLCWSAAFAYAQPKSSDASTSNDAGVTSPETSTSPMMQRSHSSARPSPNVAPGSIEVEVVDVNGEPAKGTEVTLAILQSGGAHRERKQKTNAEGKTTFVGLEVGKTHAYLARLFYQGARFQSPPFQLPIDRGFAVAIRRLETTRDPDVVVISGGQLSIWRGEERLEFGQTVRLRNTSRKSYVFPDKSLSVQLPTNFRGFEPSPVMGNQRFTEIDGRGFTISGSLMPGETTLAWKFVLPVSGGEANFSLRTLWKIESYRIVADASSGMTLNVERMPNASMVEEQGHRMWVTSIELSQRDAPLREVGVKIGGILGSGRSRWVAAFLSFIIASIGILIAGFAPRNRSVDPNAFARQKERLFDRAAKLKIALQEGRIAERRYQRGIGAVVDELSDLLAQKQREQLSQRRTES